MDEIVELIADFLSAPSLVMGIGNPIRGDDAVGCYVSRRVGGLDAGIAPENYIGKIARLAPSRILIVDAVHFDGAPGDVRWLMPSALSSSLVLSHGPTNVNVIEEFLKAMGLDVEIRILAIQPRCVELGVETISDDVLRTANIIVEIIERCTKQR